MYASLRKIASLSILLLCASVLMGQTATGTYPYGTFDSKGIDTINVGNLNAHLAIPVIQKPGRGMPFSYALSYDSSVWQNTGGSWQPILGSDWGWLAQAAIPTGYVSYSSQGYSCPDYVAGHPTSYWRYSNWAYIDPYGGSHSFGSGYIEYDPTGCDGSVQKLPGHKSTHTSISALATDGSGLSINVTASGGTPDAPVITTRNGQTIIGPGSAESTITDTNGNQISVNAGVFTDTTGVNALTIAGQAPNPVTLTYPTPTGSAAYTMRYGSYTVQTNFGCSGISEYSATNVALISEIDLPDSSKYTFSY